MRTAIIGALVAAVAVAGSAQLVLASGDPPKETKDKKHTYEVLVDGKVVAKGKLSSKEGKPQSIEVKIDGDTVMSNLGWWGGDRSFVLGDGELPKHLKELNLDQLHVFDGSHPQMDMKQLQEHMAKMEDMLREHFGTDGKGTWVWPHGELDPKALEKFHKQMELSPETMEKLRELTELKLDGFKGESTFVLPGKGLRLMDDESVPTVKFEADGSYQVLLGGKEIARGKVEPKDSRSVSITVNNGDYKVEINGKVVAEGKTPERK